MAPDGELPLTPRPVDHLDGRVEMRRRHAANITQPVKIAE
jgi:hypothetical protein